MTLKNLLLAFLFLLPISMYGQDTIYLDKYGAKTKSQALSKSYKLTVPDTAVTDGKIEREYYLSNKLKSECHLITRLKDNSDKKETIKEGKFQMWFESGKLRRSFNYHNNKIEGELTTYWENGQIKRHDIYKDGKQQEGKCYDENANEVEYYPFQKMPEYPGGETALLQFISRNVHYPIDAQEAGIQGRVVVEFVIDIYGVVDEINVKRSLGMSCDNEAVRIVSMLLEWKPGMLDGEPVSVWYVVPITFKIS